MLTMTVYNRRKLTFKLQILQTVRLPFSLVNLMKLLGGFLQVGVLYL